MDGGLYFQFGSLIGWKGGALANGGTGVGSNPYTGSGTQWWGGATKWSWANDAMVWPADLVGSPTSWPQDAITNQWYFGLRTNWSTPEQNIRDFPGLVAGALAEKGVGEPCTYYLGGNWRLPTTAEQASITGVTGSDWISWTTAGVTGRWAKVNEIFVWVTGPGAWFGPGLNAGTGTPTAANLFFSVSGIRNQSTGSFNGVTIDGNAWSSSVSTPVGGYRLLVHGEIGVFSQNACFRFAGLPVRCVSE